MTDERLEQILRDALTPRIDDAEIVVHQKEREIKMKSDNRAKRIVAAAIAFVVILVGGGTVYAAGKYFGLMEFSREVREELPKEAEQLIETEITQTLKEDEASVLFDCSVKEALCDNATIRLVYEVSAKEKGKYLFVPEADTAEDDMSDWSDISGITAREYAAEHDLTIVYVGGGIVNTEELGMNGYGEVFRSVADDVMEIYIRGAKENEAKSFPLECMATARIEGEDTVERQTMQFLMEDMSEIATDTYQPRPQEGEASPQPIEVLSAKVSQTELGAYVDVYFSAEDIQDIGVSFRFYGADGTEWDWLEGSGIQSLDDGTFYERFSLKTNGMKIGDRFQIEPYDYLTGTTFPVSEMARE